MAIISFGLTTKEFLSGRKSVTRRDWSMRQYNMWVRLWNGNNLIHEAWDKLPFAKAKKIGQFRLTAKPNNERLDTMTAQDLIDEGGMCKTVDEFCKLIGKKPEDFVTVIRFEPILEGSDE